MTSSPTDTTRVEGKLLSEVYGGNYPGSIKYENGKYMYGKIQGGLQPHTGPVELTEIPVIKACSDYPGGGLVLVFNAEGTNNSYFHFHAAPAPKDFTSIPEALQGLGGNCPPVPTTTPAPFEVSVILFLLSVIITCMFSFFNFGSPESVVFVVVCVAFVDFIQGMNLDGCSLALWSHSGT